MENNEVLEALRALVNKTASALTAEDKDLIATLAKEHGVTLRSKRCGSCYIDAAVEIFGKLSKEVEPAPEQTDSEHKYVLKDGVDILHNGVRLNFATITDELAERMIASGLSLSFFAKHPEA